MARLNVFNWETRYNNEKEVHYPKMFFSSSEIWAAISTYGINIFGMSTIDEACFLLEIGFLCIYFRTIIVRTVEPSIQLQCII